MRKIFCLIFILFTLSPNSFAKEYKDYIITLKSKKIDIPETSFYFNKVIDARENKSNLGIILVGGFNEKRQAKLEGGINSSIQNYLNLSLSRTKNKKPLVFKINKLNVSVKAESFGNKAIAISEFEYGKILNGKYIKLFKTNKNVEKQSMLDCNKYHEENIRKLIEDSLKNFVSANINLYKGEEIVVAKKVIKKKVKKPKKRVRIAKNIYRFFNYQWKKAGEIGFLYNFEKSGTLFRYRRENIFKKRKSGLSTISHDIGYYKTAEKNINVSYSNGISRKGKHSMWAIPVSVCMNKRIKSGFMSGKWGAGVTAYYYSGSIDMWPYDSKYANSGIAANLVFPGELIVLNSKKSNLVMKINIEYQVSLIKEKYDLGSANIDTGSISGLFLGISIGGFW